MAKYTWDMEYVNTKDGGLSATLKRELNRIEASGKEVFAILLVTSQIIGIVTREKTKKGRM